MLIIIQYLLKFIHLTLLKFVVLNILSVIQCCLCLLNHFMVSGQTNLFLNFIPLNHLIAIYFLFSQLLFLLKNASLEGIQVFLEKFILNPFQRRYSQKFDNIACSNSMDGKS